jgi:hypothetical protein
MLVNRHKRQILLFLVAILVPAGALISLAVRILYQDRELGAKRATDQRRAAVEQVRRELSSRLEAIKLQEINRLIRLPDSHGARGSANPVLFTATVENDRLELPWEAAGAPDNPGSEFAKRRQAGEAQEFIEKKDAAAAASYRLALSSAGRVQEAAEARLALARALSKTGNNEEATRQYRILLDGPADAMDEQGVGFRYYAAERLLAGGHDADGVRATLRNQLRGDERLTLPELYMIRGLLGSAADDATSKRIADRIGEMQQAEALAKDFPRVRAQVESGAAPDGSVWVPYGQESWLVAVASAQPPLAGLVIAVSSAKVTPPGIRLGCSAAGGTTSGKRFQGFTWNGPTIAFARPHAKGCRRASGSRRSRWCWGLPSSAAICCCAMSTATPA